GAGVSGGGHPGARGAEDPGGSAQPDRLHEERPGGAGDQHAERPRGADRRGPHPRRGGGQRRDVHHDDRGGARGGRGVPGAARGGDDRDAAAGTPLIPSFPGSAWERTVFEALPRLAPRRRGPSRFGEAWGPRGEASKTVRPRAEPGDEKRLAAHQFAENEP